MTHSRTALNHIGSAEVPGNPGTFYPEAYIRPGMPGFKGVGAKLSEALTRFSVTISSPVRVNFYVGEEAETNPVPLELSRLDQSLGWWTLYQLLSWPSLEVLNALPDGFQLGCMVEFSGGERAVRVQIDWENGHNIGFRPLEPGWAWNTDTIFATSERH